MAQTIQIDGEHYSLEGASEQAKGILLQLQFAETQLQQRQNMHAVLTRAKNSYLADLKQEIIANRGGLLLDD